MRDRQSTHFCPSTTYRQYFCLRLQNDYATHIETALEFACQPKLATLITSNLGAADKV
jgi:hypothetical protein